MNNFNDYLRITNYDFSEIVIGDKIVVKFKIKSSITPYDFLTIFSHLKGERFAIKTPNKKGVMIGIGHEYTWNLDSNDFLTNYDNTSILEEFQSLVNQTTDVEIDKLSDNYFGIYGGVSNGQNKKYQEWIDFSDTMFFIPSILAVFLDEFIEFTLFFKLKKNQDFISVWKEKTEFLLKLDDFSQIELEDPIIEKVREIYPDVWQENIRLSLEEINQGGFKRISLSRKNQLLLEKNMYLAAVVKYFMNKNLYFIAFESRKSIFITSNPLISYTKENKDIYSYIYIQKENLFNGVKYIDFNEIDLEQEYISKMKSITKLNFDSYKDKKLVGRNIDIYSVFKTSSDDNIKSLKILSLLYPMDIIKGYPYEKTKLFLEEKENLGYGFWYSPVGYINSDLDANFYTCGNMMVSFENIITMFTTIMVDEHYNYDAIINNSNLLVEKNLRLFKKNKEEI
ncbi:hypothetical protein [Gemelliphila palaticanis]|uniref:Uncharacterized protein n=1 Tax=Gemelliphila palaticanis TaxID=81950 RepID=A0ABX2T059_9BACL|nr:hypothetical protein [Gemella palaticanis]MBF0715077.1 hypothetical protein [Gemella palaticanis]NYS47007.1 hypothetical protein [Gemella palaticanis]